jgi:hypothetical protein
MRNLKSIPNPIEQALILDVEHDLIHLSYLLLPFLSPFFLAQALARGDNGGYGCAAVAETGEGT